MMKILKASCQQIAYIESLLLSTGTASRLISGNNVPLWEVQKSFQPVVYQQDYEVITRGFFPVKVTFEFNNLDNVAHIRMSRKGLNRLREVMPEKFADINDEEGEEEFAVQVENRQSNT